MAVDSTSDKCQASDAVASLAELLAGVDPNELASAIDAIRRAKELTPVTATSRNSVFQDQEYFMPGEDCFIYRRGTTKKKIWYLRIYDKDSGKPYIKSLRTDDKAVAIIEARKRFLEITGKIERGERIRSITTKQMIEIYLDREARKITNIPKDGITPSRFRVKKQYLGIWERFIKSIGCEDRSIDRINPERTRDFGYFYYNLPKEGSHKNIQTARSKETINNAITEVRRCYKEVALKDRYISLDRMPQIERLTTRPSEGRGTKDILEIEEYETLYKYLRYQYTVDKSVDERERLKRRLFTNILGILNNTGLRTMELRFLRWHEIKVNPNDSKQLQKTHRLITIRQDNSKTGISRTVNAPIAERIKRVEEIYKKLGCELQPDDYVIMNPERKDRAPYTRELLAIRLKVVLEKSGLQKKLDQTSRKVTLYSCRHQYITWRLRFGQVPIQLVAKNCGTSINMIEKTYGKIATELETELLTRNQSYARNSEIFLRD